MALPIISSLQIQREFEVDLNRNLVCKIGGEMHLLDRPLNHRDCGAVLGCIECVTGAGAAEAVVCTQCNAMVPYESMNHIPVLMNLTAEASGRCRACMEAVPSAQWRTHATSTCKVKFLPCTEQARGCSFRGSPEQLAIHKQADCAWAEVECNDCKIGCLRPSELAEHMRAWCVHRKAACTIVGCATAVRVADLPSHERICPWRLVACIGSKFGCLARHPKKRIKKTHENECQLAQCTKQVAQRDARIADLEEQLARKNECVCVESNSNTPLKKRQKNSHSHSLPAAAASM